MISCNTTKDDEQQLAILGKQEGFCITMMALTEMINQ